MKFSHNPIVVVDFPSPKGVGLIPQKGFIS